MRCRGQSEEGRHLKTRQGEEGCQCLERVPGHGRRGASPPQPVDSTLPHKDRVHSLAEAESPSVSGEPTPTMKRLKSVERRAPPPAQQQPLGTQKRTLGQTTER